MDFEYSDAVYIQIDIFQKGNVEVLSLNFNFMKDLEHTEENKKDEERYIETNISKDRKGKITRII